MELAPDEQRVNSVSEVQRMPGTKINISCQEMSSRQHPKEYVPSGSQFAMEDVF